MEWRSLSEPEQVDELIELSKSKPVLLFKHSTRCGISAMALNRLERKWKESNMVPYYLDLIRFRETSNFIAEKFDVIHQSPQAILLKNGKVAYDASHSSIDFAEMDAIASDSEFA